MVSMDTLYNDFEQESEWDIYGKEYTQELVENDAIDSFEAGFLHGYDNALDDFPHTDNA